MVVFYIVAAVWYTLVYLYSPNTPKIGGNDPSGYLGWADQTLYLNAARDLSHGELTPNKYFIGYSLIAAPFYPLLPRHAFFIPDLLLVLIMAGRVVRELSAFHEPGGGVVVGGHCFQF